MALDEYLYGKISNFFKKRRQDSIGEQASTVKLNHIKQRLTIFARAITGHPIEIFIAKREGGYKNNNFFLPEMYTSFPSRDMNLSFYLFRVLYLSIQKNMDINWHEGIDHDLGISRREALETAPKVLNELFDEFPITKDIYKELISFYESKATDKLPTDYSFIYGKWMRNVVDDKKDNHLNNFNEKAKKAVENEIKTILQAKSVEEVVSIEVDTKQQEDYVLTHNFEKLDTAEEHEGGWRDFDGDDELDKQSKALEELNMKYTVRVDDPVHSIYQADFVENITVSESAQVSSDEISISYDEWNYKKREYREDFCKIYPKTIREQNIDYYNKVIKENTNILMGLRKMLTNVNNKYQQQRRQLQGDEFDLDALTDMYIDIHSGHVPSEKVYLSKRKKEKDLSILMLLDISLSTDGYAANNRIIDVEKEVSILFGEILNEFNVDFSIDCFYSKTRNYANYLVLKDFDEDWSKAKYNIGSVQPEGYTRIGVALRHSGALLAKRQTKNKWLILISDGKPNDYDRYEGKYGVQDVKQALKELNQKNINSYALAIEANAKYYLPQMFGPNHYEILTTPVDLLKSLAKLYEKIKFTN